MFLNLFKQINAYNQGKCLKGTQNGSHNSGITRKGLFG